jgi:uncharacterized membrane protein YedE/YeeE
LAPAFSPLPAFVGGILIGLAAALLLAGRHKIAGISGIAGGFVGGCADRPWRGAFLLGLLSGGIAIHLVAPTAFGVPPSLSLPVLALGGLLVGIGTRLGSGCTSGHGVCGISRGSPRSLVATAVFIGVGMLTVYMVRHILGGG